VIKFHASLNVSDLAKSIEFYTALFGTGPVKAYPDYAKFEIVDAPGRRNEPVGSGQPVRPSGVMRSSSRRVGVGVQTGAALNTLPVAAGSGVTEPVVEVPMAAPPNDELGETGGPPLVVALLTGTGIVRIAASSARSRRGNLTVRSACFSPSWTWVAAFPPTAALMTACTSAADQSLRPPRTRSQATRRYSMPTS
jgi:catechol 2,3-dioxygenase-like lactoylglutathione lyase family enzyme